MEVDINVANEMKQRNVDTSNRLPSILLRRCHPPNLPPAPPVWIANQKPRLWKAKLTVGDKKSRST